MFLRPRLFRRVPILHVLPVPSSIRPAPLEHFRLNSVCNRLSDGTKLGFQQEEEQQALMDVPITRPDVPLHDLTARELLNIIQCTVEARPELPVRTRKDAGNEYSSMAVTIYTSAYIELRHRGAQLFLKRFPEVLVHVARRCVDTGNWKVLDFVVEDILAFVNRPDEGIKSGLVERQYLALENIVRVLISRDTSGLADLMVRRQNLRVIELCRALLLGRRPSGVQPYFPLDCLSGILASVTSAPCDWDNQDRAFLEALLSCVEAMPAGNLGVHPNSRWKKISLSDPAASTLPWLFFRLIRTLLDKEMRSLVASFLHVLLQKEIIPAEAATGPDPANDFRLFVLLVLARSCVYYGSPSHALALFVGDDLAKRELRDFITVLANEALVQSLAGKAQELEQFSEMISRILAQNPAIELDKGLVKAFFKVAHKKDAMKAAETMYASLLSASVFHRYMSCFLCNSVAPWLLSHLIYHCKDPILGRRFVQGIATSRNKIAPHERGDIIALCAAGGYISETRALWERYAAGHGGQMVTAHTKCMVGIVRLFKVINDVTAKGSADANGEHEDMKGTKETKLGDMMALIANGRSAAQGTKADDIGFTDYKKPFRQDAVIEPHCGSVPVRCLSSGIGTSENSTLSTARDTDRESNDLASDVSHASKVLDDRRDGTVATALNSRHVESSDLNGVAKLATRLSGAVNEADADEYYVFALKVLDAYRSAKEPLNRASHYDLNALSRASDLLGKVRLSMRALQIIVDRREVPDTGDLNVVIMAMAARDPERAEEMLMLMLQEGMHLNARSFSAVILGWLEHGNTVKASRVYSRAVRAGYAKLPSDAANALLYACLDACHLAQTSSSGQSRMDKEMHRTFLRQVYSLIASKAYTRVFSTRELGTQCLSAALRLEEAGLAFSFWKRLLKTNVRKESDQEKELRQAVAILVKKAMEAGMIDADEGSRMISEVGKPPEDNGTGVISNLPYSP